MIKHIGDIMAMSIKFETIKNNAIGLASRYTHSVKAYPYIHLHHVDNGIKPLNHSIEELHNKTAAIISNWDIRNVQELTHLFPSVIPKKYANINPTIDMDDDGDWVLLYS